MLKGHERERFYSPILGTCVLASVSSCAIYVEANGYLSYFFRVDGRREATGDVMLFPSRALYEQYQLDPYTAWMEWQEDQQQRRLEIGLTSFGLKKERIKLLFNTPAERDKALEEIKAFIQKFNKK